MTDGEREEEAAALEMKSPPPVLFPLTTDRGDRLTSHHPAFKGIVMTPQKKLFTHSHVVMNPLDFLLCYAQGTFTF